MECFGTPYLYMDMKRRKKLSEKNISLCLFGIYLFILVWTVLFKGQISLSNIGRYHNINLIPFAGSIFINGKIDSLEIFANVFVFIPLGLFLSEQKHFSFKMMLLMIVGISTTIEILQYVLWVGVTDITDIIGNTIGGLLGILIYKWIARLALEKTSKVINVLGFIFVVSVFAIIVLLQTGILETRYFW